MGQGDGKAAAASDPTVRMAGDQGGCGRAEGVQSGDEPRPGQVPVTAGGDAAATDPLSPPLPPEGAQGSTDSRAVGRVRPHTHGRVAAILARASRTPPAARRSTAPPAPAHPVAGSPEAAGSRRRLRFRLWHLLALVAFPCLVHLGMVRWRGEPTEVLDCHVCGAQIRCVLQRLFGTWPVMETRRTVDSPWSRLVRDACGYTCTHPRRRRRSGGGGALAKWRGESVSWCGFGRSFGERDQERIDRADPRLIEVLTRLARQDPEDVRCLVHLLLVEGGWPFSDDLRAQIQDRWESLAEQGSLDRTVAQFSDLLPEGMTLEVWRAERALLARAATTGIDAEDLWRTLADPNLVEWYLLHGAPETRSDVMRGASRWGFSVSSRIAILSKAVRVPNSEIQHQAVAALASLAASEPAAIVALGGALESKDPGVRENAMGHIQELGSKAMPLAPALVRAMADPDVPCGRAATCALRALGPGGQEPVLKELGHVPPSTRMSFLIGMCDFESAALRSAYPVLRTWLSDPDRGTHECLTPVLGKVCGADPDLAEYFLAELAAHDPEVRRCAADVLGRCLPPPPAALPLLRLRLLDPDERVRVAAAHAVGALAPALIESDALLPLVGALASWNDLVRVDALMALWSFGPRAIKAREAVSRMRDDPDGTVRQWAWGAAYRIWGETQPSRWR